jgi:alkanesulfonate monooxygenase
MAASARARLFSTCPVPAAGEGWTGYARRLAEVARWSEAAGCEGALVYTENRLPDPWLVAHLVLGATERLAPLVAVQPAYAHPFAAARTVANLSALHGRRLALNMVAGGFGRELEALGAAGPHDERYARLGEYARIVKGLLWGGDDPLPFTFRGRHYAVENLRLAPPLPPALRPEIVVSGSSEAGRGLAAALDALAVHYPDPAEAPRPARGGEPARRAVRVGLIARETEAAAWRVAEARFPPDRRGEITHRLAAKASDSSWHRRLSEREEERLGVYWLRPFRTYKTFCPYLVGDVGQVAGEVARYLAAGFEAFVLDIPPDEEELGWSGRVFARARELAA